MFLLQQNTFEIQCSSQAFGKQLQLELSALLEKTFYPRLELLFQKYDYPKQHWVIDCLEIEIPNISKKYWKEELVEKTLEQIEAYLIRYNPKNNVAISKQLLQVLAADSSIVTREEKAKELLFTFLQTGILPSNSLSDKISKIMEEVAIDQRFVSMLIALFKNNNQCLVRWIFSIPETFKNQVIAFLSKPFYAFDFWEIVSKNKLNLPEKEIQLLDKFTRNVSSFQIWNEFIQWSLLFVREDVSYERVFHFLKQTFETHWGVSKQELQFIIAIAHQNCHKEKGTVPSEISNFINSWQNQLNDNVNRYEGTIVEVENKEIVDPKANKIKTSIADNFLYIKNAGLVLLHPFLTMLFEQLQLTNNQEWTNATNQQKGILLLHYLVHGEVEIEENQLVLNKILCGFEVDEVVNTQIILEPHEKEKCISLLEAVLEHWSIMRSSSKEALQETFLQREGKLEIQSSGYELWIAEKGYDILLEQLPWGIGMVKTPWMDHYLTCNWNQ